MGKLIKFLFGLVLVLVLLVLTLLVSAPVIDSSVLAVRRVSRLGDTLTTSLRCASARTWFARIWTDSAFRDGNTACTEPPVRRT